jgi:acyl dehydratase
VAGKFFDELAPGQLYKHQPGRTVTEADNLLFTVLSMNTQPLHLDAEFARQTEFGQRLVNSLFTLSTLVGLSVSDLTLGTTVGNLGFEKVEFPRPVLIGDTLYAETEVISKRESRSRPGQGIVTFEHRAINQRGELVARCLRNALMLSRQTS